MSRTSLSLRAAFGPRNVCLKSLFLLSHFKWKLKSSFSFWNGLNFARNCRKTSSSRHYQWMFWVESHRQRNNVSAKSIWKLLLLLLLLLLLMLLLFLLYLSLNLLMLLLLPLLYHWSCCCCCCPWSCKCCCCCCSFLCNYYNSSTTILWVLTKFPAEILLISDLWTTTTFQQRPHVRGSDMFVYNSKIIRRLWFTEQRPLSTFFIYKTNLNFFPNCLLRAFKKNNLTTGNLLTKFCT